MLLPFIFLCFKIHPNTWLRKIHYKNANFPLKTPINDTCSPLIFNYGSGWSIIDSTDLVENDPYYIKCHGSSITVSGSLERTRTISSTINLLEHGLFDIKDADFNFNLYEVYASGSLSDYVQMIHFRGTGNHLIQGTKFKFCGIYPYSYVADNNQYPPGWDPSLIVIEGESTNVMNDCTFTHPKDQSSPHGWELYNVRCIKCIENSNLNLTGVTFYNATSQVRGAFLNLQTTKDVFILDCKFEECFDYYERPAHAIAIQEGNKGEVNIENCNFINCGKNVTGIMQGPAILVDASGLIFVNNIIQNTNDANRSFCIQCCKKGKYIIKGNIFINSCSDDESISSCIQYDGIVDDSSEDEFFDLSDNVFDRINGFNHGRCINAMFQNDNFTFLNNISILNCPLGGCCIKLTFKRNMSNFTINSCNFINNSYGGAGILIENPIDMISPLLLFINDCYFISNNCESNGGALFFSLNEEFQVKIEVCINTSEFSNNTSEGKGGAIAISTCFPPKIINCTFCNNSSTENGGSIFIETQEIDDENILINNCQFTECSSSIGGALYLHDSSEVESNINIVNCTFCNITAFNLGGAIYSEEGHINIINCIFLFCQVTKDNSGDGGAIFLNDKTTTFGKEFINNTFENCSSSNNGGTISIMCNCSNKIYINNCIFTNCTSSKNGGSIYSEIVENTTEFDIYNSSFMKCSSENNGGALFLSSKHYIFIEGCIFESNIANNGDGGALYMTPNVHSNHISYFTLEYCCIQQCLFKSNIGNNGYAICITGNDFDSEINITGNSFTDNYNKETINDSFIISIETCCISRKEILSENSFSNQENGVDIIVNEFSCARFITDTMIFSVSNLFSLSSIFTQSNLFTYSSFFSYSRKFSQSFLFSCSGDFTTTYLFTQSEEFSQSSFFSFSNIFSCSNQFTPTLLFSQSNKFTKTSIFSLSNEFTATSLFSESNRYTKSSYFSHSNKFTKSIIFSDSQVFTESSKYTKSNEFTKSTYFTHSDQFTDTSLFPQSNKFSKSLYFSYSNNFSKSIIFSDSQVFTGSSKYTKSYEFTKSTYFTHSYAFTSTSSFLQSDKFSKSSYFSHSNKFTKSIIFSDSQVFTESSKYTNSNEFTKSTYFTHSDAFIDTYSDKFSKSSYITYSNELITSDKSVSIYFTHTTETLLNTQSSKFTKSLYFSSSYKFTKTSIFSYSRVITKSSSISLPFEIAKTTEFPHETSLQTSIIKTKINNEISISISQQLTYIKQRSVSLSYSIISSNTIVMSYLELQSTYTFIYSSTAYRVVFPYIIYYLSPSFASTFIHVEIKKSHLSQEQLIGISCGSATVFFLVLAIIILAFQKKSEMKSAEYEFSFTDESNSETLSYDEYSIEVSSIMI